MPESKERQIAYKVRISDLFNGNYVIQGGWDPNYIELNDQKISRVNIIAAVVDKQLTDKLATITVDDGTATIVGKSFNEEVKKIEDINVGDVVLLVGRPRKYNEELFISVEIIKKVDPAWAKVRKLELEKEAKETTPKESLKVEQKEESPRQKIISILKKMDNSDGVDISEVLNRANIENGEELIDELVREGEIYENKPGKVRALE